MNIDRYNLFSKSSYKSFIYYYTDKELTKAAVMKIFGSSVHHFMIIGAGLDVNTADVILMPGNSTTYLDSIFQKWFDRRKNVSWDALRQLCDAFPDQLGQAKSNLLEYTGKL